MTLDETIEYEKESLQHCKRMLEEIYEDNLENKILKFEVKQHDQLAEWLEELKKYKSLAPRELVSEKQRNDRTIEYSKGFDYGFKTGYNKAIDDLLGGMNQITYNLQDADELFEKICDLAELLKVGEQNEQR